MADREQNNNGSWRKDKRSSAQRGYGYKWRKARGGYLRRHPLCVMCEEIGVISEATVVDHIKPHQGDKEIFWDKENWQPLCKHCHDSIKQRIEKQKIEAIGCNEDGVPLDHNHHWNQ